MAPIKKRPLGKKVGTHTYWHKSLSEQQPPSVQRAIKQAMELCKDLPSFVFNIIKLDNDFNSISLLNYPDFFDVPFPALSKSWKVDLISGSIKPRSNEKSSNPPILHRKELLIPTNHSRRSEYMALTKKAEELGLFENPRIIGLQKAWYSLIESKGFYLSGHDLLSLGKTNVSTKVASAINSPSVEVQRHRTALTRYVLSKPMQTLAKYGFLEGSHSIFDYGCGKGSDVEILVENNITAYGWDPHFCPENSKYDADIVNLGFVINVIEDKDERINAILSAYHLCGKFLCASVMLGESSPDRGRLYRDGVLTTRNTFQKYFSQEEFRAYLSFILDEEPVAVGPGIFFIFKDKEAEQGFLERRYRNRGSTNRLIQSIPKPTQAEKEREFYQQNASLLDTLWMRWIELGRPPQEDEFDQTKAVKELLGTWKRGLNFLKRFHGDEVLKQAFDSRRDDLMLYFAMRRFETKRVYRTLPESLKRDVKTFFNNYQTAQAAGEKLLFSAGNPQQLRQLCQYAAAQGCGYIDDEGAFTFHTDNASLLPSLLRVYIGCATQIYGDITGSDLLKIHSESGKMSLMKYDDFEGAALPRMLERIKINLVDQTLNYYKYGDAFRPPYLYLKSRFVTEDYPHYLEQKNFDQKLEQQQGILLEGYGMPPEEFDKWLEEQRLEIEAFELRPSRKTPDLDASCGKYHNYRDFIECGETQIKTGLINLPEQCETYNALADLAIHVIDPVMEYFGGIKLTYGFCSRELAKHIPDRVAPNLDQHASHELNSRGNLICKRLGAACDFIVLDESMLEVAQWIVKHTQFDRLYFYGDDKPVHVSFGPENSQLIVMLTQGQGNRLIPRLIKKEAFLKIH